MPVEPGAQEQDRQPLPAGVQRHHQLGARGQHGAQLHFAAVGHAGA